MEIMRYERTWPLDDLVVRSTRAGRSVEAYAAVFGIPTEIRDQHGHYVETIHRSAFDAELAAGFGHVSCFYHHGMTLHGVPSDLGSVPIGSPVEIEADRRGLRTLTRLNHGVLAEAVLEAIHNGDIRGYSFRGPIRRSEPARVPRIARSGQLPPITRLALGLTEYGPTPTPAYAGAEIVGVR